MEELQEVEEVLEDNEGAKSEPKPKQRRKRRTKAEIEADRQAEAKQTTANEVGVASAHEEQVESSADAEVENPLNNSMEDTVEAESRELPLQAHDPVLDRAVESVSEDEDYTVYFGTPKERAQSFTSTLRVYEAPVETSRSWQRLAKYRICGRRNGFYRVSFVKPAHGLTYGYVKESDID